MALSTERVQAAVRSAHRIYRALEREASIHTDDLAALAVVTDPNSSELLTRRFDRAIRAPLSPRQRLSALLYISALIETLERDM